MLSNNTTTVEIIKETNDTLVVKVLGYFANGSNEVDSQIVNAAALLWTTLILTQNGASNIQPSGFIPGELVTGNISAATGYVMYFGGHNSSFPVVQQSADINGTFTPGELLTGNLSHSTMTLGYALVSSRRLDIESVAYDVSNCSVGIEWGGYAAALSNTYSSNANAVFTPDNGQNPNTFLSNGESVLVTDGNGNYISYTTAIVNTTAFTVTTSTPAYGNAAVQPYAGYPTALLLSESGYMGRNALQAEITPSPSVVFPDGNIYLSTYGVANGSTYSIILEFRKQIGFSQVAGY